MFCTVLHSLKSPMNVGMIIRTHVAFGGAEVVFVGYEHHWHFRKGSQAFSRKLERLCDIVFLKTDDELFDWAQCRQYSTVAIEIDEGAIPLSRFKFPPRTALVVGNEARGLTPSFMTRCNHRVVIPQFGHAECLNVAVSCSIALYELSRNEAGVQAIQGAKFISPDADQPGSSERAATD